jgi:DNA modification methylase/ParB-like chromosome segregation protein Spo0J
MRLTHSSTILVGERQRKEIGQKALDELKRSIVSKGLLHPPVLTSELELVAGERRLRAMQQLHEEGIPFWCDQQQVPANNIPYLLIEDLTSADLAEAELEENILRAPLTMLEEVQAKALIHELRKQQNPSQTIEATAAEISLVTGISQSGASRDLRKSLLIANNLSNPKVQRAKSKDEAYRALLDEAETVFQANLQKSVVKADLNHQLIHGDCLKELPKLANNLVSTIISDPPYGIKADKQGKESNHYYDDDPATALPICEAIIREGFRISRSRAILFMFCDVDHFIHLRTYAAQHAWTPWPKPLIWHKGDNGHAPWGRAGFRRTYEMLLFAVKGQAELRTFGGKDVFDFPSVSRGDRLHAAEKPHDLLSHLISISTLPGELVLDPCAGSGSIIPAAVERNVRTICIERDHASYALAVGRLAGRNPSRDLSAPGEQSDQSRDAEGQPALPASQTSET